MTLRALPLNPCVPRQRRAVALGVAAALLVIAGGCSTNELPEIRNTVELEQILATSSRPVLVDFYKGGCVNCAELENKLGPLAAEYGGRVLIAKFMLMGLIGGSPAPAFAERNDIWFYPTVILYVNGREKHRFVMHYIIEDYRRVIRDCLASPTTRKDAGAGASGARK
jgi:thiol:disulfide interchange protein DsbD